MLGSITLKDIFLGIDPKKIQGDCDISRTFRTKDNRELCIRITGLYLDLIFTDLLTGKGRLGLTKGGDSLIQIKKYSKEEFIKLKKNNVSIFKDQDPFKTGFVGYYPSVCINRKGFLKWYTVFLNSKYKKLFIDSINDGCKFNDYKIKYYNDYVDLVHDQFKLIHKKSIEYILKFITNKLYVLCFKQYDIHLTYKKDDVSIFIQSNYNASANKDYNSLEKRFIRRVFYLSKFDKYKFDGYYYFTINDKQKEKFDTTNSIVNVKLYKYFECTMAFMYEGHVYKVKLNDDDNKATYIKSYEKSDVEYVSRRNELRSRQCLSTKQYTNRLS